MCLLAQERVLARPQEDRLAQPVLLAVHPRRLSRFEWNWKVKLIGEESIQVKYEQLDDIVATIVTSIQRSRKKSIAVPQLKQSYMKIALE